MAGHRNDYRKRSHPHSDYGDNGGSKRRNQGEDRDQFIVDQEDCVYRYLCPGRKIGSIIGRGGDIVKQLRHDTKSKIRIGETISGCEERVVTIYSSSDETNSFEDSDNFVSPAQDALFKVHDRVIDDRSRDVEDFEETPHVTARLLVPSDQIGCIIGKGGQIVQNIRTESGAQIRILKDNHLPACALFSDELVQISGEFSVVKKALYQIASRLHDNPSRSQCMLSSALPILHTSGGQLMSSSAGGALMGLTPFVSSPYGGYKSGGGDWSGSIYSAPRRGGSSKDFSICLICPTVNIGSVIGKNGVIINQIRQESGAMIRVDSSAVEGADCLINISAEEFFEDTSSPAIEAAVRLQPRCSDRIERDSGIVSFTTRLLVPTSHIGCLIGKGGSIISEMRKLTKANIRIFPKEDLPKIASEHDELVQISGDLDVVKDALIRVTARLRANLFDRDAPALVPVLPYLPMSNNMSDDLKFDSRDSRRHDRGPDYSDRFGSSRDLSPSDRYGGYSGAQAGSDGGGYGDYGGGYSSGRAGASGFSSEGPICRRKNYVSKI